MDRSYMESVMWAFKQLWDKDLVYEGFRVMPYSWAVETPLSNFEIRMDNSYRPRQDPAVTVAFDAASGRWRSCAAAILVWTTTPWTLPSNLAMAVGDDIDYAIMKDADGQHYVIGAATRAKYEKELADAEEVGTVPEGQGPGRPDVPSRCSSRTSIRTRERLPHPVRRLRRHRRGHGHVHMAPGFGEDDSGLRSRRHRAWSCPVDEKGRFTSEVVDWAGTNVLEANPAIIAAPQGPRPARSSTSPTTTTTRTAGAPMNR